MPDNPKKPFPARNVALGLVLVALLTLAGLFLVRQQSSVPASAPFAVTFPNTGNAKADLAALMTTVNAKVNASLKTEEEMAPELRQFEVLLAAHAGDKGNDVVEIAWARAKLLATSLHQPVRALELYRQIMADYPGTAVSQEAAAALPALEKKIDDDRIHRSLAVGTKFPDFSVTDMNGRPLSPSQYAGHVLLIEFWAAWCPDCHVQVPKIMALYRQYHAQGFEVIGVSLDSDRNLLTAYLRKEQIPWPQYFDGKYWDNALVVKYGVHFTPQNYLLDGHGVILGKDLEGDALVRALKQAMAGE